MTDTERYEEVGEGGEEKPSSLPPLSDPKRDQGRRLGHSSVAHSPRSPPLHLAANQTNQPRKTTTAAAASSASAASASAASAASAAAPALARLLFQNNTPRRAFAAQPAAHTSVPVEGDAPALLKALDAAVSAEAAAPADVADAALALALLQARGDRRLWGKVFERAGALQAKFDPASLTTLLWASGAAGVGHFRSTYDLGAAASRLLPALSPQQLGLVAEALGRAGAADGDLLRAVGERVAATPASAAAFSPADLARVLWGFAAAGAEDARLAKVAGAALAAKAGEASARDLAQASWALAKMRRSGDGAMVDALGRALASKLPTGTPQDAAAAAWAFATLGAGSNCAAAVAKAAGAALKAAGAAALLTPAAAADAAWGLALLGAPADAVSPLLARVAEAIQAAPDAVPVSAAAAAAEAAALSGAPLSPPPVLAYCRDMRLLAGERLAARASSARLAWRESAARAGARALCGARYKPEVDAAAAAATAFPPTEDGASVDLAFDLGGGSDGGKVALVLAGEGQSPAGGAPGHLGAAEARRRLLELRGFKGAAVLTAGAWKKASAAAAKGKGGAAAEEAALAAVVLEAVKAQCPGLSGKVAALQRMLAEPFDPYA